MGPHQFLRLRWLERQHGGLLDRLRHPWSIADHPEAGCATSVAADTSSCAREFARGGLDRAQDSFAPPRRLSG